MQNKTTLQELEDIFNMIPKDGSNIKETEEDDDNGYASINGDTTVPFETKASELAAKLTESPETPLLTRKVESSVPPEVVAPVVETKQTGDALEATLVEAVATKPPTASEQFDMLDEALDSGKTIVFVDEAPAVETPQGTMKDIVVPGYPKPIIDQTPILDKVPETPLIERGEPPMVVVEGEKVSVPLFEIPAEPMVIPMTSVFHIPATGTEAILRPQNTEEKVPDQVMIEKGTVDKEGINSTQPADAESTVEDDSDEPEDGPDGWLLTTDVKQFEEFYRNKRWSLKRLLPNGRLPFTKWGAELAESKAIVECSYDTTAMFEQMKYIQSLKVRVTEIIQQLNSQYFKWKRFMSILRADCARMEGTKVAQSDAAAMRHLRDFEDYYSDLEALMETSEHVIKNLESGWDTLNRGVTIVLQAHGHERGMTRYEPQGYVPLSKPLPQMQQEAKSVQELGDFDSLDTSADEPTTPKKKGSDAWDVVQDFGRNR